MRARLKLQGRYWRIYLTSEFQDLVQALQSGKAGTTRSAHANLAFLSKEIRPLLTEMTAVIQRTHPNYDLEKLISETFKLVPGVQEVKLQGGAGDHGADLIVRFESGIPVPGLQQQHTCVVQVKSYVDEHWDTQAVHDLRRAFDFYPEATMGLIVSTATSSTHALEKELEDLHNQTHKPVALLIGADVASFLFRFGGQLLV